MTQGSVKQVARRSDEPPPLLALRAVPSAWSGFAPSAPRHSPASCGLEGELASSSLHTLAKLVHQEIAVRGAGLSCHARLLLRTVRGDRHKPASSAPPPPGAAERIWSGTAFVCDQVAPDEDPEAHNPSPVARSIPPRQPIFSTGWQLAVRWAPLCDWILGSSLTWNFERPRQVSNPRHTV